MNDLQEPAMKERGQLAREVWELARNEPLTSDEMWARVESAIRKAALEEALNEIDVIGQAISDRGAETQDAILVLNGQIQGLKKAQKAILALKEKCANPSPQTEKPDAS